MLKNTAGQKVGAQLVSATDGSAFTGSVTVAVTGDAGTQATGSVGSGACTHEGNGYHTYAPAQAETNYDLVAFTFTGTGAVPVTLQVYTRAGDAFTRLGAPVGASISADIAGVQSDANDIQSRLPAALVSGRMDSSTGAMAANVLTATAIAADAITDAKVAADVTIASVTGAVGSVTGNVGGNVTGSVGSVATGGITAASFAADAITAAKIAADVTTELQSGLATASALATVAGYIDTEVASILAAVDTEVAAIKAKTDALPASPAATGDIPTAATVADAVWDETLADHLGAGSTGAGLNAAGSAGDPWATTVPGAYGAGSAGKILGDNLNATVSSRSSHSAADVWAVGTRTLTSFGTLVADIWASATRTLTAISDSSGTTTLLSRIVGTLATGTHQPQSGDAYSRLGAPAGASTAADIAAVSTLVADVPTNAELATALAAADDAVLAAIAALNNLSAAQVKTQVVAALATDTYAEPTAPPAATAALAAKLGWLTILARNVVTQTATTQTVKADNGTTDVATAAVSDDGSTFTRGEWT